MSSFGRHRDHFLVERLPIISLAFVILLALTSCHDKQSDDANATMAVDDSIITTTDANYIEKARKEGSPYGQPPYMIFCDPKDPRDEPIIASTPEWIPLNKIKHPKGYKKCEESGAL